MRSRKVERARGRHPGRGRDVSLAGLLRFARGQEDKAPFLAEFLRNLADQAQQAQEAYSTHAADRMRTALRAGLAGLDQDAGAASRRPRLDEAAKYELAARLRRKEADFERALTLAHRLTVEATADDGDVVPGQTFTVRTRVWNQGAEPVALQDVALARPRRMDGRAPGGASAPRSSRARARTIALQGHGGPRRPVLAAVLAPQPEGRPLRHRDPGGLHTLPWSPPDVVAVVRYGSPTAQPGSVVPVTLEAPAFYRYEGRWVGGEKQKVVNVVPALSVALTPEVAVMPVGGGRPPRVPRDRRQRGQGQR